MMRSLENRIRAWDARAPATDESLFRFGQFLAQEELREARSVSSQPLSTQLIMSAPATMKTPQVAPLMTTPSLGVVQPQITPTPETPPLISFQRTHAVGMSAWGQVPNEGLAQGQTGQVVPYPTTEKLR